MRAALIVAALTFGCSSSTSSPNAATDAGGGDAQPPPPVDHTYLDDAGVEHHADGGLTTNGCLTLGGLVGQAKQDAKSCANVPGVCQTTVKDECGCSVYVEDPTNDFAKSFTALAAELYAGNCANNKCAPCPDTSDGGLCEPQAKGPAQCVP